MLGFASSQAAHCMVIGIIWARFLWHITKQAEDFRREGGLEKCYTRAFYGDGVIDALGGQADAWILSVSVEV
jgi:hypothetical protein